MSVRFFLASGAKMPQYQSQAASGMDLESIEERVIEPGGIAVLGTGVHVAIPDGYEGQIRPRSGLSSKGLGVFGTIDADYRGEIGVILVNLGKEPVRISRGMRIAQLVVARHARAQWREVKELDRTARGAGGFGSTGVTAGPAKNA